MKHKDMNKTLVDNKSLSSYWMNDWNSVPHSSKVGGGTDFSDVYKLASGKRAIANFVRIVTNKNIPVTFKERGDSYTNGTKVVISSKIDSPKYFDIAVGLALHEGSHILKSDFDLLKNLSSLVPDSLITTAESLGIYGYIGHIKSILNYIEDRRIDFSIYTDSPGYQGYYQAMYNEYFYHKIIDVGLLSTEYRTETIDSYMFRIINLHNKNTQLDALKGLREIYRIIDLQNISRLKSTADALSVAFDVYEVMLTHLINGVDSKQEPDSNDETDDSSDNSDESRDDKGDNGGSSEENESNEDTDDNGGSSDDADSNGDTDGNGGDGSDDGNQTDGAGTSMSGEGDGEESNGSSDSDEIDAPDLTSNQKRQLDNQIKKQNKFIDGDVNKKQVTKSLKREIDNIDASGISTTTVGEDVTNRWGNRQNGIDVIVVKKMTKELMEMGSFPLTRTWYSGLTNFLEAEVNEGIRIGKVLGKKLQTRGESRTTVFNRQKTGKLDKRLVSSLGFGNESVFQFTDVDTYKKANLHVSIDASGSMDGIKWKKTITNVVALCKAVDMIPNLQIQVSIRTTSTHQPITPYVVMAYDSRVDKFSKVKQLFPSLDAIGITPEGLCFEAIINQLIPNEPDVDSYFLNISDGEPYFVASGYEYLGEEAHKHTRKMVKMIESRGIQVLSYFISDHYTTLSPSFTRMYGNSARAIDITNVSQIVKTVNQLFMKKSR